jgi:glycine oxidase
MPGAHEVVVVGAGVVGCAIAFQLAKRGVRVLVLERSVPGSEASSAAAGMLAAQMEAHESSETFELSLQSRERFARWAEMLREETGIDVEYRRCGIVDVALDDRRASEIERHAKWQRERGLQVELLDRAALQRLEPAVTCTATLAAWFERDARVDPPRFLRALRIAAERRGAEFRSGHVVRRLVVDGKACHGVELEGGDWLEAQTVVVAAGPWSSMIPGVPLAPEEVRPARGQIVELSAQMPLVSRCIWGPGIYMAPRDDGRLLLGATVEFVGFEKLVTAGAVHDLLHAAMAVVPRIRELELARSWSAFRPYTGDGRPRIGASALRGLVLATGHFRNGILLSPITAEIVEAIVTASPLPPELEPFRTVGLGSQVPAG